MEKFYLIDYINQNFDIDKDMLDTMRCELDQRIYYYGNHFYFPKEFSGNYKAALGAKLRHACGEYSHILKSIFKNLNANKGKNIISNAYFTVNEELENIGYNVYKRPWYFASTKNYLIDMQFYNHYKLMKGLLDRGDFVNLISKTFLEQIKDFKKKLEKFYVENNISALIVPNDIAFWENLSIKVFKEIRRPSFIFLHGLPARYNNIDENRTDYLIVWGDKIKEHYVKTGIPEEKILVSGHPYYKSLINSSLRFDLDSILIISKSMNGGQYSNGTVLTDRGNMILYLLSIQKVLSRLGIKKVRFRPHPSENPKWYYKFIDKEYFVLDSKNLSQSLKDATLVIGPASTVFLEATYYGVNYLIYELSENDIGLDNYKLVPPFDGSDPRIPVAKNENDLNLILDRKKIVNKDFWRDYVKTPFNIDFIKQFIS